MLPPKLSFFGNCFYFSSANKQLSSHIEDLNRRLDDQEDIRSHEVTIDKIVKSLKELHAAPPTSVPLSPDHPVPPVSALPVSAPPALLRVQETIPDEAPDSPVLKVSLRATSPVLLSPVEEVEVLPEVTTEPIPEENLDDEIAAELSELSEASEHLKK